MVRYASVIGVRPEKLEEYKRLHANAWPEVLDMIKKCNIQNYSISIGTGSCSAKAQYPACIVGLATRWQPGGYR